MPSVGFNEAKTAEYIPELEMSAYLFKFQFIAPKQILTVS